jgi:DNA polymerase-1
MAAGKEKLGDPNYCFELNSTQQLTEFVKNVLKVKLSPKHVTKTGLAAMDEKALEFYAEKQPVLKKILDYRLYKKQNATYLLGFKEQANLTSHRIYPEYAQHSTATGRLSSFIHTVPRENKIRNMIVPAEGCKFVLADESQIELRILAQLSNDQNMINAFKSGMDFHAATACVMFGIDPELFDKKNSKHAEARDVSKSINFGIVYGMGARSLAEKLKILIEEAEKFMNKFFKAYPDVRNFIDESIAFAEANGYVETLYGRKRYLHMIKSSFENVKEGARRQATNTKIQSSANDVTAMALIKMQNWLDKESLLTKIVATIHDSIMLESPMEEIDVASKQLVNFMTVDVPFITVPLKADVQILDRWIKE